MDNDEKLLDEAEPMAEDGNVEEQTQEQQEATTEPQGAEAPAVEVPAASQVHGREMPLAETEPAEQATPTWEAEEAETEEAEPGEADATEPAEAAPTPEAEVEPEVEAQVPEAEVAAEAEPEEVGEAVAEQPVETEAPEAEVPAEAEPEEVSEAVDEPGAEGEAVAEQPAEAAQAEPTDDELFLQYMSGDVDVEGAVPTLKKGQLVEGTIASISDSEIVVDIGAKSEGVIQARDLERLDREDLDSLEVGQEITTYVVTPEGSGGHPVLSLRKALEEQDWTQAEEYLVSKEAYESKVKGFNKGGLIVPFGRIRGFVPASQVSMDRRSRSNGSTPQERWGDMVGDDINVKVIEVDRGRNRLILSERAATREQRAQRRDELLEELEVGQVREGRVVRLTDFGAFVDLGGADGLIHVSQLSWRHVNHPKEVLNVGDKLDVEVISVDRERERIGLSRKNVQPDPWDTLAEEYHPGQLVQGKVTKLTKFGAFAALVDRPGIEGLIHISELADHRVAHPKDVVAEKDVLTLRILRIEPDRRRLGLSLKRVDSPEYMDEDWQDFSTSASEED